MEFVAPIESREEAMYYIRKRKLKDENGIQAGAMEAGLKPGAPKPEFVLVDPDDEVIELGSARHCVVTFEEAVNDEDCTASLVLSHEAVEALWEHLRFKDEEPDARCISLPDGSCVSESCMHTDPEPIVHEDGSPSEATKAFARDNPFYEFAYVVVPAHVLFPHSMLSYDRCEFVPSDGRAYVGNTDIDRTVVVRRSKDKTRTKFWTPKRWKAFSVQFYVLSGESR